MTSPAPPVVPEVYKSPAVLFCSVRTGLADDASSQNATRARLSTETHSGALVSETTNAPVLLSSAETKRTRNSDNPNRFFGMKHTVGEQRDGAKPSHAVERLKIFRANATTDRDTVAAFDATGHKRPGDTGYPPHKGRESGNTYGSAHWYRCKRHTSRRLIERNRGRHTTDACTARCNTCHQ